MILELPLFVKTSFASLSAAEILHGGSRCSLSTVAAGNNGERTITLGSPVGLFPQRFLCRLGPKAYRPSCPELLA